MDPKFERWWKSDGGFDFSHHYKPACIRGWQACKEAYHVDEMREMIHAFIDYYDSEQVTGSLKRLLNEARAVLAKLEGGEE